MNWQLNPIREKYQPQGIKKALKGNISNLPVKDISLEVQNSKTSQREYYPTNCRWFFESSTRLFSEILVTIISLLLVFNRCGRTFLLVKNCSDIILSFRTTFIPTLPAIRTMPIYVVIYPHLPGLILSPRSSCIFSLFSNLVHGSY